MNFAFEIVLRLAQVPDQTIADLEKDRPQIARLCRAARGLEPLIHEAMPHLEALKDPAEKAFNILETAWPDIVAVGPLVMEFIEFANKG